MKKAGLMSAIGAILGSLETMAGEATKAVEIVSLYTINWQEERQVTLAEARHDRAQRWAKLGASIRTQELNTSDAELAMRAYKGE